MARDHLATDIDLFWRLSQALQKARLESDCVEIADVVEELDALALHTDSQRVRRLCRGQIAAVQKVQAAPGSAA